MSYLFLIKILQGHLPRMCFTVVLGPSYLLECRGTPNRNCKGRGEHTKLLKHMPKVTCQNMRSRDVSVKETGWQGPWFCSIAEKLRAIFEI